MRPMFRLAMVVLLLWAAGPLSAGDTPLDPPTPGMWYDPTHNGHGFDLQRQGDTWFFVFYTYGLDGLPVYAGFRPRLAVLDQVANTIKANLGELLLILVCPAGARLRNRELDVVRAPLGTDCEPFFVGELLHLPVTVASDMANRYFHR